MTISVGAELRSNYPVHPGAILAVELAARGMTQRDLAAAMQRSARMVSEIVRGRRPVTAEVALDLETALDIPAQDWVNLQARHDLTVARLHRAQRSA